MKSDGFGLNEKIDNVKLSDYSHCCATLLANEVQKRRKRTKPVDIDAWALCFDDLREDHSEEDIDAVLRWYLPQMGKSGLPVVFSAESFQRKFSLLLRAMNERPGTIQFTEEEQRYFDRIIRLGWRGSAEIHLTAAFRRSVDSCRAFHTKLIAYRESTPERLKTMEPSREQRLETRILNFANWLWDKRFFCTPLDDVQGWFNCLHSKVSDWPSWSGKVNAMAWRLDQELYMDLGRERAQEFTGEAIFWDYMLEAVLKG